MEHLTYSLKIPDHLKFEDIIDNKNKGARFVFFECIFPRPFFRPAVRISKIYYLQPGEMAVKFSRKYNVVNLLIGWWGLPFGPEYTYRAIKSNLEGIDITDDIYANITEESFQKKKVTITKIENIFMHPDKDSAKEMTKCFKKFIAQNGTFKDIPIFALYTDTETPYFVIGLNTIDIGKAEELRKLIYKYFYKENRFDLIDINDETEFSEKLKKQGLHINCQH
ncbi:hypothetical protein [Solitalea canadensis]|uniref:Uncharacterized protein n=1 Tax=Solitalea canadensis (strain ATCC 29591 / DSM 3403 / JCM 21819 / LMG 8368 / NBRC 15130 / NCIMB 12057 / USAM 9D) TaxID=929556 RepID=H8KN85_SOLCM|nr:hypothetical protein [Solitalea canadensis]AFD09418.1 hypothetical protein Solca_4428 [Solitalea canadensis DSM 3403]